MRRALQHSLAAARHLGAVVTRRVRHGPSRPSWPWRYELALGYVRWRFAQPTTFAAARRGLDALPAPGALRGVATRDVDIAGVRCVEHRTAGAPNDRDPPVLVYLHGGGYCTGSPRSHRPLLGALTRATGARVLAVDYRLAPEHPCPAAIDDVLAVLRALLAEGIPPRRLWLAGDSAGGGLTLTSLVAARDAGLPRLAGAIPISPWADLTGTRASHAAHVHDYLPAPERLRDYARAYAARLPLDAPQVSPAFADLSGLPPLLLLVGGAERLYDDGIAVAERARDAGVDVTLHVEPDEAHVWPLFHLWSPRAADAVARIAAFMARPVAPG
jgi:monoterpene epsilon-lactone hydrolase